MLMIVPLQLNGRYLANNSWGWNAAECVIPLSLFVHIRICIDQDTCFNSAWFFICPCRILACQWSVIDPVERIARRLSVKSNPRTPTFLFLYQVSYKVILIGWSDYGEVSTQILASRTSVAPYQGWSFNNMVTWMSMKSPTWRTI